MAGAYYDPNQGIGYSSTPFGVSRPQSGYDIRMRQFMPGALEYGPMGLLNDNSRLKERVEGRSRSAPGASYAGAAKNSGMAPSFSSGNTPSNPGGKNWDTFTRNLDRAVGAGYGAVAWRMDNKRNAVAKQKNQMKQTMQNYADAMSSWDPTNNYNMAYSSAYGAAQPSSAPNSGAATNTSQKTRNPARRKTSPKINSPKP